MNNQFKAHRILTAFGVFILGFETMNLDFNNFFSETNKFHLIVMLIGIVAIGIGMYLQRKDETLN